MLWMLPAWVAWCWSGTGDDQHQDDDVVDDDIEVVLMPAE